VLHDLESLTVSPDLSELSKDHPRGMSFRHSNDAVVRQVVFIFQDRLRDLNIPLRLRLEPLPGDRKNAHAPVPSPNRLTVVDADLRWAIPILTMENAIFIGEKLCVTRARDNAVQAVAAALVAAIREVLGDNEE
jgi:hypothetical protein